jgi:lipoprotein
MRTTAIKIIVFECMVAVLLLCACDAPAKDGQKAFADIGSKWEDAEGMISFSVSQEIWYLDNEDLTEKKRLLAFGTLHIGKENIPISGIWDNNAIVFSRFGHSVDYTTDSGGGSKLFKLSFDSENPDEAQATVLPLGHGKDTVYLNDGDVIRFARKNSGKSINSADYQIYVSLYDIMDSSNNGSDIRIYRRLKDLLNSENEVISIAE